MSITVLGSYKSALKKYADFSGRLSRKGYWFFVLGNMFVSYAIVILGNLLLPNSGTVANSYENLNPLSILYSLALFLPAIAAQIRRLHDINKSGWSLLLVLIPLVGPIIILIYFFQKGDQVDNAYGPVPSE